MRRKLLIGLLPLAACASSEQRGAEALEAAAASSRANLAALGTPPATRPAAPSPAPRPPAENGGVRATSQLIGASPERLLSTLGEPALRREEGGASVWLYAAGGCHLDIFLYPSAGGPRVAHVQARAGGIAQRSEASCLRDVAAQRRPAPAAVPDGEGRA